MYLVPILFVSAEYDASGDYTLSVFRQRGRADLAQASRSVVIVVVCGRGVVSKPYESEVARRVVADNATFLSSRMGERVSFVRRDRLLRLAADLKERNIIPVGWFCMDTATEIPVMADGMTAELRNSFRWVDLLKPTTESSAVLQAFFRRVYMPVLVLVLIVLAVNAVMSSRLNVQREQLRSQLAVRDEYEQRRLAENESQRAMLRAFANRPKVSRAVVCDHIAAVVPEKIRLISVEVDPLTGRLEAGKKLRCNENAVVVTGEASTSATVSTFVAALSEDEVFHTVRLSSIERRRDGNSVTFQIDLKL